MQAVLNLPKKQTGNGGKTVSLSLLEKFVNFALEEETAITVSPVSWKTYSNFVREGADKIRNPRFYYENETLLIMPTTEHESNKETIVYLINILAEEFQINCRSLGSATFRAEDIKRGFEPDSCFYFANEAKIRGVKRFDSTKHPAPDLIIEVDITSSSEMRESIFAAFRVPELWRYDGEKVEFLKLKGKKYVRIEKSLALPLITSKKLAEFVSESEKTARLEWIEKVRKWARDLKS
jgi:Uma2 family endonuclease